MVSKAVPEGWKNKKLVDVGNVTMGQSPSSNDVNDSGNGVPFLQGNAEFSSNNPAPAKWCTSPLKLANKGDILLSVRAPVGALNIADQEYCIGRGLAAIRFNKADSKFGWYALFKCVQHLKKISQGSTFESVNKKNIEMLEFILPSLPEQRKIAAILSSVDEAIEKTKAVIEQTKVVKKGLMQELLTRGIPGRHKKFKRTAVGEIPEEWEVVRVGELCDYIVPGRNKPKLFKGKIPWITTPDIVGPEIKDSQVGLYVSLDEVKKCGTRVVPSSSVIMSCVGEFGIIAITTREIVINQQLHAFIPSNDLDINFLRFSLILQKPYMEKIATKTAVPYMNKFNCNSIPIPKTPIDEQKNIINVLLSIERKERIEQEYLQYLNCVKTALMQVLLTGELRVQA
ncbi:MAG TPA: restriction endonuclease subunit S [Nitrospirae bacterium]|nr:restriction endonuclease subunit S [Nitrospirota bacterium]